MNILISPGGPSDRASIPLATRRGSLIPNERRFERPHEALREAVRFAIQGRPNVRLRSATAVYNCMGMIFASRRTWIDPVHLTTILIDDGYRRITIEYVQIGDIAVYRAPEDPRVASHVAVIVKIEPEIATASWKITVMSQWGADGEYIHPIDEVPIILGKPVEFWTDRREAS